MRELRGLASVGDEHEAVEVVVVPEGVGPGVEDAETNLGRRRPAGRDRPRRRQEDHWADDKRDGRTTYYSDEGVRTLCIDYAEVNRGCYGN